MEGKGRSRASHRLGGTGGNYNVLVFSSSGAGFVYLVLVLVWVFRLGLFLFLKKMVHGEIDIRSYCYRERG